MQMNIVIKEAEEKYVIRRSKKHVTLTFHGLLKNGSKFFENFCKRLLPSSNLDAYTDMSAR